MAWSSQNLGFEDLDGTSPRDWSPAQAPYESLAVSDVHRHGEHALRIRSVGTSAPGSTTGVAIAAFPADSIRGKHLTLHAWARTSDTKGSAAIFLRVDGAEHAFANSQGQPITGTNDWTQVSVGVDVPARGERVVFGPMLIGEGTVWFDDLGFELSEPEPTHPIVLEGKVIDAHGQPAAGADVALSSVANGIVQHVRTDASGAFHFATVADRWAISAQLGNPLGSVGGFLESQRYDHDATALTIALGDKDGVTVHGRLNPVPPTGSYVAVAVTSEHNGDTFAVPVASDGTFQAILPRGESYGATLLDGNEGRGVGKLVGDHAEIAVTTVLHTPAPQEVVDWISGHAIRLTTPEAGHGFDDIAPLGALVGKARIVALGEVTHGTREFFQLKHRVLEYLVAKQGFTAFAIEANEPECRVLNDYVLHGVGSAQAGLDATYFWVWNTQEVLAMIEWMRAWNADPAHTRKVQFFGMDMQFTKVALANLTGFLTKLIPDAAPGLLAPLKAIAPPEDYAKATPISDDGDKRLTSAFAALAAAFDTNRAAWLHKVSTSEFDDARHDVTILEQFTDMSYHAKERGIRDRAMAANVIWILDHQAAGTRMVVWAHNGHIANKTASDSVQPMGSYLRAQHKYSFLNLGFVFSQGSFQAIRYDDKALPGRRVQPAENTLDAPPDYQSGATFARTGLSPLIIDLRALPKRGSVHDWFMAPHPTRETGALFSSERNMTEPMVLPALYDAVIFVDKTTRSRPNHARRMPGETSDPPQ